MEILFDRRKSGGTAMGKEISLARKEVIGQPVLLCSSGTGASGQGAIRRKKGKKIPGITEGNEGSQTIDSAPPRPSYATVARRNRKQKSKHGNSYSFGESIREVERRNRSIGRSAQELGIKWLADRCEESAITHAHYLIGTTQVDYGTLYTCKFCGKVKWLPNQVSQCIELGTLMKIRGFDAGYQAMLDLHPAAKRIICKIQDLSYLRKSMPPEQFPIAVSAIMLDRQYPYDVELTEEEML
jgi:hypothetical protein